MADASELLQVGVDKKIANELVLLREKGFLKTTGDLVAVLEKNNTDYKVQLEESILVRVNSSVGDLSHEKVEEKVILNPADKINISDRFKEVIRSDKRYWTNSRWQDFTVQRGTWPI